MKNVLIKSTLSLGLTLGLVTGLMSCSKPSDRPSKIDPKFSADVVPLEKTSDVTSEKVTDQAENKDVMTKAIAKIKDADLNKKLTELLESNKLSYMIVEGKLVLLAVIESDTTTKMAHAADAALEISTQLNLNSKSLYSPEALVHYKQISQAKDSLAKESLTAQLNSDLELAQSTSDFKTLFVIVAEIKISTGILENEHTDYNEKKSLLEISPTDLDHATHIQLMDQIKDDASGASR